MRENAEERNKLVILKDNFSKALENGDMKKANEMLNSIDETFINLSGKSFRSALSNEQRIKIDKFMNKK